MSGCVDAVGGRLTDEFTRRRCSVEGHSCSSEKGLGACVAHLLTARDGGLRFV